MPPDDLKLKGEVKKQKDTKEKDKEGYMYRSHGTYTDQEGQKKKWA